MKKLILLLALLGFTSAFAEETSPEKAVYVTDQLKMVVRSHNEQNRDLRYVIKTNSPQIDGENLTPAAIQFNILVNDTVNAEIAKFKQFVAAEMPNMQRLHEDLKRNYLVLDYDLDIVKPGKTPILSLRLSIESMIAGQAHPSHTFRIINFDLANNKEISFNDLFKPNSKFLKFLSSFSRAYLKEKLEDKSMITAGTKPSETSFKNWNLESDNLLVTFDVAQIAPYNAGVQEIRIPYSDLKKFLAPTAPIAVCATNPAQCEEQA